MYVRAVKIRSATFCLLVACGGGPVAPAKPTPTACEQIPWQGTDNVGEATYRGQLSQMEAELPNGEKEKSLILTLDRPVCSSEAPITEVQVYGSEDAQRAQLDEHIGKAIAVTGPGFAAHTAHHHRPIVVEVKQVAGP